MPDPLTIAVAQPRVAPFDVALILDARARRVAADHGVWVAVASFAGPAGGGFERGAGRSAIWSSDGAVVARAGPEAGAVARATLA